MSFRRGAGGGRRTPGVSAFLTVQEGCDKFCAFCVVPYTRGAEVSRSVAAVLAEDPDSVDAHRLLAAMYYDAGVIPQAIRHLEETARLAPADHRPSRLLGLVHSDYERYDDAVGHYVESLTRAPDQADRDDVLAEMAACEVKLRRHREALATLDRLSAPTDASEALRAESLAAVLGVGPLGGGAAVAAGGAGRRRCGRAGGRCRRR